MLCQGRSNKAFVVFFFVFFCFFSFFFFCFFFFFFFFFSFFFFFFFVCFLFALFLPLFSFASPAHPRVKDGQDFADIEKLCASGSGWGGSWPKWAVALGKGDATNPDPSEEVFIPKGPNGKLRPLGPAISGPCGIRVWHDGSDAWVTGNRSSQADLPGEQYAYRPGGKWPQTRRWSRWEGLLFAATGQLVDADPSRLLRKASPMPEFTTRRYARRDRSTPVRVGCI